ncbi:hypothetical protein AKJ54_00685 [candidate division MSBL1 archaeon SCGC-AAA382K21]|uniref:Uncharacterized protein n=1 Tax=candidate division MSBL1 archaeon SCGC-AAA382K21 TaxID=1698283 RepID=A0A133VL41_9EURY|nr:hypothetical protein AKJ54_00685 [candidate division MSBL1 archaeon SCGC-AAA382K21]
MREAETFFKLVDDEEEENPNENEEQEEINLWLARQLIKESREKQHNIVMKASEKAFWKKAGIDYVEP